MKTITEILLLGLLIAVPRCGAQDQPVATTVNVVGNGRVEISVTNYSQQDITAFVMVGEFTPLVPRVARSTSIRYIDSVMNGPFQRELRWKDTQTYVFGGPNPGPDKIRLDVSLKAALFADGSSFGDPEWVRRLVDSRGFFRKHLEEGLEVLQSALATRASREELIQKCEEMKAAEIGATRSLEERTAIRGVFNNIRTHLRQTTTSDGSAVPVEENIQDTISLFIERRQRLLASKPDITRDDDPAGPF